MAHSFAVQAQLQVKGPPNLRPIISQIKAGLSNIKANVGVNLSPSAVTNVGNLNARLTTLNKNLIAVQSSGKGANAVLQDLATTFNSMRGSAASVAASINKVNSSVNSVSKTTKSASKSMGEFGELVGQSAKKFVAFSLAAGAVAGFVFSIQNGFRDAIKFQHELVKLAQVGGDSAATIKDMTREITRLSTTLGVSSQGLVETAVTLRQAGLTATETKKALEALAKTELAPTFDNIAKTTEGAIAIMAQFKVRSKDLEGALGSINTVSAKYAVESGDLIEAVRRSGGAFKAAGGNLNEFLALFTSVRATTRESAESIATGFRTIFARLQQPGTIQSLKKIGVSLDDMEEQFVGPYEAVKRLSEALKNIPTTDNRFSKVVEQIGGIRQVSKVIPLLKEFNITQQAYNDALAGQSSLTKDAATAQQSLTVRITKLKEEFLDLFRVISENSMIQAFIGSALSLASALIRITRALEPLIPLLTVFAAVKLGRGVTGFAAGIAGGLTKPAKFARGGSVPGSGNGDTVPAMLTPGEFVIKKSAAQAIGHNTLKTWNKYANGGPIELPQNENVGQIALRADKGAKKGEKGTIGLLRSKAASDKARAVLSRYQKTHPEITPYFDEILGAAKLSGPVDTYVLDRQMSNEVFEEQMAPKIFGAINGEINKHKPGKRGFAYDVAKDQNFADTLKGFLFEAFLSVKTGSSATGGTSAFDFDVYGKRVGKFSEILKDQPFRQGWYDAKANRQDPSAIIKKAADQKLFNNKINITSLLSQMNSPVKSSPVRARGGTKKAEGAKPNTKGMKNNAANMMASIMSPKRYANGGRANGTDTVPAMLTPGEFVINKESARAIGHNTLSKVNKINKFAKGGPVGFATGGTVSRAPSAPIDMSGLIATNLKDFFKNARSRGATNVDISRYTKEIMESLVEQVKRGTHGIDDKTARARATGLFRPDQEILMNKKGKFMGSKQKEEAISKRFNDFLASPGDGAPYPLNRPKGRFSGLKGLGGKVGKAGLLASVAAPFIGEQLLGSAEKPGALGRTGAGIASVAGAGVSGAAAGAFAGSTFGPVGAAVGGLVGGLAAAGGALISFRKDIEDIDFKKVSDEINTLISRKDTGSQNNLDKLLATKVLPELASLGKANTSAGFGIGGQAGDVNGGSNSGTGALSILFNGLLKGGDFAGAAQERQAGREQEASDKFKPILESVISEFNSMAAANPGKTVAELDKMNPVLAKAKFHLARFDMDAVKASNTLINNAAKQQKAQAHVDLTFTNLAIAAEELSVKISATADTLEKNFARNAVGRGGRVSGGVDTFNVGALGEKGRELQEFSRVGGGIDQSKEIVKNALMDAIKGGALDQNSVESNIMSGLGKGGLDQGAIGAFLKASIGSKLGGDEGEKLLQGAKGDPVGTIKALTEDFEKVRPLIDRANQDLVRAQQMFAQNAVDIAGQMDTIRSEQERIDQFRIGAEKDRATTLMRNNDVSFMGRGGGVITPEDQMNEINVRAARESFASSQNRFGVSREDSANPAAILSRLAAEQTNLSGLKGAAQDSVKAGTPKDFSMQIAESTQRISYFQQALKNLATSTTVLEAAQGKLNTALEKEAADMAGRKKVGEERAFGSRGDIVKSMMADRLVGVAAQQGHLENFSDEQRAMTFSRLQETSGVERNIGGQRVTGQQIIDAIAAQYAPQTNIPSALANTPNGVRAVSKDVLGAQANVSAIQGRMGEAGDALQGFALKEIADQTAEHGKAFDKVITDVTQSFENFLKVMKGNGLAKGGMAKGTDTIPAMLSPGEFVVNAKSTSANKDLLHQINGSKTRYAASGGEMGWSPFGSDEENKRLLKERAKTERAREIAKRVARREKLGLPEYTPMSKRVDSSPANAFNDPQAAQMRGEQLSRESNNTMRTRAAQNLANQGNQRGMSAAIAMRQGQQGQQPGGNGGMADAARQFVDNSKPFVDALNSFPRELVVKRDGVVQVVINGVEAMSKIKGDLEKEVWAKIIETIQQEVPKAVKKMPG